MSSLCLRTRLLFLTCTAFQPVIRLEHLCSSALSQGGAKNSLLGACTCKSEVVLEEGCLLAWFLLGPVSSTRVLGFSLEKFWLEKAVAHYRLTATRTVEAV